MRGNAEAPEVSVFRLYVLRATYLLLVVGLGPAIWPGIIHHANDWPLMQGVVSSLLGAVSILAVLGLRHPLQMLPLLLFELVWKAIWLIAVAAPLWLADAIDARTAATVRDCLLGVVIFPLAIPWPYVFANYLKKPGERWR